MTIYFFQWPKKLPGRIRIRPGQDPKEIFTDPQHWRWVFMEWSNTRLANLKKFKKRKTLSSGLIAATTDSWISRAYVRTFNARYKTLLLFISHRHLLIRLPFVPLEPGSTGLIHTIDYHPFIYGLPSHPLHLYLCIHIKCIPYVLVAIGSRWMEIFLICMDRCRHK